MKLKAILLLLSLFLLTKSYGQSQDKHTVAKKLIEKSMQTMGGEAWKSVQSLSLEGYGNRNIIDQSERPEGPFIPGQFSRSIVKDFAHDQFLVVQKSQDFGFSNETTYLFNNQVVAEKNGGKLLPTLQGQQLYDELYLSPELVLKTALAATDLVFVKDTTYQKAAHSIILFKFEGYPVRVFLNKETDLLTAVEITKPYKNEFFNVWGDSKRTIIYSFWMLLDKGLHYPVQEDVFVNGWPQSSFLIDKWKINPVVNTDSLKITDGVKKQEQLMGKSQEVGLAMQVEKGGKEIAPGVWFLRGFCNSTIIEQPDGLVIIEGPLGSYYGDAIIKKAKTLFPGKRIKALITTSDAWLHIGGVRAFAAIPGIKIYHPARNRFILDKLLKATYTTEPDALAKTLKPSYTLTGVTDTITVGSGKNRLVLYAYRTETGDRMMMVYFPTHKIVYTSDLYQPKGPDGKYWNSHIVWEVYHSIQQRKLDVKQFYAMHAPGLIPFEELANDVKAGME